MYNLTKKPFAFLCWLVLAVLIGLSACTSGETEPNNTPSLVPTSTLDTLVMTATPSVIEATKTAKITLTPLAQVSKNTPIKTPTALPSETSTLEPINSATMTVIPVENSATPFRNSFVATLLAIRTPINTPPVEEVETNNTPTVIPPSIETPPPPSAEPSLPPPPPTNSPHPTKMPSFHATPLPPTNSPFIPTNTPIPPTETVTPPPIDTPTNIPLPPTATTIPSTATLEPTEPPTEPPPTEPPPTASPTKAIETISSPPEPTKPRFVPINTPTAIPEEATPTIASPEP